jgi:hypothetical protein
MKKKIKKKEASVDAEQIDERLKVEDIAGELKKEAVFFKDDYNEVYAKIRVDKHNEILPLNSVSFKQWLIKTIFEKTGQLIKRSEAKDVTYLLECYGRYYGEVHNLFNRVAVVGDCIYLDLTNENWGIVRIDKDGWEVIENSDLVLFRRYQHQKDQVVPEKGGDIRLLDKFLHMSDESHKLLLYVHLVTSFIADIPHSILSLFGPQGSSKSTKMKMLRSLIDPSKIVVFGDIVKKELVQTLCHHWVCYFDNVGVVRKDVSNLICACVTGAGFTKRKLYTDSEDVIYNFKRILGVNGINIALTQPDVSERSILIETQSIDAKDRLDEQSLWQEFNELKPKILGGILDVLSRAMKIRPSIKNPGVRMADFALWGEAVSQAMGYSSGHFLKVYKENMAEINRKILDESVVGQAIIDFMKNRIQWEGTATELFKDLTLFALSSGLIVNDKDRKWVQGANALSRKLNELKPAFSSYDIDIIFPPRTNTGRKILLVNNNYRK